MENFRYRIPCFKFFSIDEFAYLCVKANASLESFWTCMLGHKIDKRNVPRCLSRCPLKENDRYGEKRIIECRKLLANETLYLFLIFEKNKTECP